MAVTETRIAQTWRSPHSRARLSVQLHYAPEKMHLLHCSMTAERIDSKAYSAMKSPWRDGRRSQWARGEMEAPREAFSAFASLHRRGGWLSGGVRTHENTLPRRSKAARKHGTASMLVGKRLMFRDEAAHIPTHPYLDYGDMSIQPRGYPKIRQILTSCRAAVAMIPIELKRLSCIMHVRQHLHSSVAFYA